MGIWQVWLVRSLWLVRYLSSHLYTYLGDIVGSVPDHHNIVSCNFLLMEDFAFIL